MATEAERRWGGSMVAAYEKWLVPTVFRPFAVDMAGRVAARRPQRVLELAAGTGVLTRELAAIDGTLDLVATDLNQAMVDVGAASAPGAAWEQADATKLRFGDGEFDLVVCQFGVMFFPDKPAAFAEHKRVLTETGTLLFSVWGPLEEHTFETAVVAALTDAFGGDAPTFLASVPHGYSDPDRIRADVMAGGLHCSAVEKVHLESVAPSVHDLAAGYCLGTPVNGEITARGVDIDATIERVAAEMARRLGSATDATGSMSAFVVEATPA